QSRRCIVALPGTKAASVSRPGETPAAGGAGDRLYRKFARRLNGVYTGCIHTRCVWRSGASIPDHRAPAQEIRMKTQLGHYEIVAELGRGGMGVVYEGYEPALHHYVAIKELSPSLAHDANLVERFLREARSMA